MAADRILIPAVHLGSAPQGIDPLLSVLALSWNSANSVILDFSQCSFITAEAVAILATFKLRRDALSAATEVDWPTVADSVRKQLGRWQLTRLFGVPDHPWTDNAVPLLHQPNLDLKPLVAYIDKCIVSGVNMPRMCPLLSREVRRSYCEVFSNIFQHSDSHIGGIAIGQLYPNRKQAQLCVCDGGIGMIQRVQGAGYARSSPVDALQWALERGHSTKCGNSCPAGLGLYVLREFVKKNGGSLRIYANNGSFGEMAGRPSGGKLRASFPGTLFELRLNIRDDVAYKLQY